MAHFAVLGSNNQVENVIICAHKELAEQLTGFTCIEYDSNDRRVVLGAIWSGEEWLPEPIYPNAVILETPTTPPNK